MFEQISSLLYSLVEQTGLAQLWWGNVVMIIVGAVLVYLALARKYEPFLLLGIGFACIVANVPGSDLIKPGGLFYYAYKGVELVILPPLIFFG
ncbi:na+-transporting methylmalonyl-coa/oxaloacetate decarboxylase beta subunit, partial [Lucifera butyrica]